MRYSQVSAPTSRILDLLNIRFVLTRESRPLPAPKFIFRNDLEDGTHVYENRNVLPRFHLVNQLRYAKNLDEALSTMRADSFDPAQIAVVEMYSGPDPDASPPVPGTVRTLRYQDREFELETVALHAAFLVTSEAYYPGWRAWIDGRAQDLVLTNGAFRGLPVPSGRHTIKMLFAPPVLWRGAAISILAFLLLCALAGYAGGLKPLHHR
jgi:uncharacterized membrane protein YfhO